MLSNTLMNKRKHKASVEFRKIQNSSTCVIVLKKSLNAELFRIIRDMTIEFCDELPENQEPYKFIGVPFAGKVAFEAPTTNIPLDHLNHPKVSQFIIFNPNKLFLNLVTDAAQQRAKGKVVAFQDVDSFLQHLSEKENKIIIPILTAQVHEKQ